MRILTILLTVVTLSIPALAQVEAVPTFTVTTNDVAQSSIVVLRMGGTNEARVTVKFAYTDTGMQRLEEFYRAHTVGQEVRYRVGSFERVFRLYDRKNFRRESFLELPGPEARALEDGLKGRSSKVAAPEAKPRLSHTEVIRMAIQAAEGAGFRLADYREPHATYKTETKTWFAFFHGVGARKHFGIFVNDETGATRFSRGP
jgi:hypothetical protein